MACAAGPEEQPVGTIELPGYAAVGNAFRLRADGHELTPATMTHEGDGSWRSGPVSVRLLGSTAADGTRAVVLEATGIGYVEEVCLLDHDITPTPEEIHNHRWFNERDMQQSTAVFLRDRVGGAFASWANPFGRARSTGAHLEMWYRPCMAVNGKFRSDALVTGRWLREGRELRFDGRPDRDGDGARVPAYIELFAAERPVLLDAGEARAVRNAVGARLGWQPRARSAHWDWAENLYELTIEDAETRDAYQRLLELCELIGIELVLFAPGSADAPASDEGPWQHIMWLGMGTDVAHGRWRPDSGTGPDGLRTVLDAARRHGIGIAAYVNPQFSWLLEERWRLLPPTNAPNAYGKAPIVCLGVPAAREWLVGTLRSFVAHYGLAGVSLDFVMWHPCYATDHPHPPGPDSVYAQWDGYRQVVAALRERPDAWVEGLIGSPQLLPWGGDNFTHACPLVWDNQPQWTPAWPDLSLDRTCANLQRRSAWWYRNLAMTPSYKVAGAVGHQANRLRDVAATHNWDWEGARFSLLSAIATGASSLSFSYLPCRDADEWAAMRERDGAFFARWTGFAREHADVLGRLDDLYEEPRPGAVDGTIAVGEDGLGFAFLVNPDYVDHRCEVPLGGDRLLREIHPEPGRMWGATVTVEPHQVHVLEVVSARDVRRPVLLGALGTVDGSGKVVTARGRPGCVARVEALLDDGRRVTSTVVFAEDGVSSSLGPWRLNGAPVFELASLEGDVRLSTEWAPGKALASQLAQLAPPVAPVGNDHLRPWSDPSRLQLFVEITAAAAASVRVSVDGEAVEVRRAYVGTFADVTDDELFPVGRNLLGHYVDLTEHLERTTEPQRRWRVDLEIDSLAKGSLRGVHVAHLPRRSAEEFETIDLLGSNWFETAADMPTEPPVIVGTTMGELLRAHSRRPDPEGTVFMHNVVYGHGGDEELLCSVHRRSDTSERRAAVLFVHGGGWAAGDRGFHTRHAHLLAGHGYVTANIEYRLHPTASWPDSLEDVKCAVRYLRAHAHELGIDVGRIGVAGGSAGGHLAAMTALVAGQLEGSGGWAEQSSAVQAAVLWYPALDLVAAHGGSSTELDQIITAYFGGALAEASPVNHVGTGAPPMLTISGSADELIDVAPLERFHASLTSVGTPNRLEILDGRTHGFDLFATGWREDWQLTTEMMVDFFDEHLGGP